MPRATPTSTRHAVRRLDRRGGTSTRDPGARGADPRGARGRQARGLHRADGQQRRGLPADRRDRRARGQGLHDDGDRRVQPRVPVHEGPPRPRRAWTPAVRAGLAHAGHGGLAGLLAGPAADALRHPRGGSVPGHDRRRGGQRGVPRLGPYRGRSRGDPRRPVRGRERAHHPARVRRAVARVHRSLFDTARQYRESIDVYGSKQAVEWPSSSTARWSSTSRSAPSRRSPRRWSARTSRTCCPSRSSPSPPAASTTSEGNTHLSFTQGGGHGGSHRHLVHAFVEAVRGHRRAFLDVRQSANWTCVGILAHESGLRMWRPQGPAARLHPPCLSRRGPGGFPPPPPHPSMTDIVRATVGA